MHRVFLIGQPSMVRESSHSSRMEQFVARYNTRSQLLGAARIPFIYHLDVILTSQVWGDQTCSTPLAWNSPGIHLCSIPFLGGIPSPLRPPRSPIPPRSPRVAPLRPGAAFAPRRPEKAPVEGQVSLPWPPDIDLLYNHHEYLIVL